MMEMKKVSFYNYFYWHYSTFSVTDETIYDDVNIARTRPNDETGAGIIANSMTSILMMGDEATRKSTFKTMGASNHVSFASKMEKTLNECQRANLERVLKNKMKFVFWIIIMKLTNSQF